MWIAKLWLTHFKNYEEGYFEFDRHVNCLVGENGSGKTNLLDAIYFLALTKSAFQSQDALSIRHGAPFFMLEGIFEEAGRSVRITCSVQQGQRKVLMADKKNYEKLSGHIGRFPLVLIAPDDTDLIRDGSETRRKFFDGVLSQLDTRYLDDFLKYNRLLNQRNAALKIFAARNQYDELLLESFDGPLMELAAKISKARAAFLGKFADLFQKHYAFLTGGRETVDIIYETECLDPGFPDVFREHRHADLLSQRTGKGVHRDDYRFDLDGVPVRRFGSQGQRKSFVIALRLAQYELLENEKQGKPILLLDDLFDKLDDQRIRKLLELINGGRFGQVFISDANPERSRQVLSTLALPVKFFEVKKGEG